MAFYQNPSNGYQETATTPLSWLWCLLFGWLYFLFNGNYKHALLWLIVFFITVGISWLIYPFFVYTINNNFYKRQGWVKIEI